MKEIETVDYVIEDGRMHLRYGFRGYSLDEFEVRKETEGEFDVYIVRLPVVNEHVIEKLKVFYDTYPIPHADKVVIKNVDENNIEIRIYRLHDISRYDGWVAVYYVLCAYASVMALFDE